jgi:small-conductance mechanosensitive channel
MKEVTDKNFGVIIAFWLPGVILLWGLTYSYPELSAWLTKASGSEAATIGGFLYVTLAALALGMVISAVRWLIIDTIFHYVPLVRVQRGEFDFGSLKQKDAFVVFQGAVETFYRFYQYYSNTLVSIAAAVIAYGVIGGKEPISSFVLVVIGVTCFALFLASRDSLKNYYSCRAQIAASVK